MAATPETPACSTEQHLQAENARLKKMVTALMDRAERAMSTRTSDFGLFQTTVTLEEQVRTRTHELETALRENERINRDLQHAKELMEQEIEERARAHQALEREREEQKILIHKLEDAHCQLLQSEKLASIGQLAAGVAHEINNPIGFVNSNLGTLSTYVNDLLALINVYEQAEPALDDAAAQARIAQARRDADIAYLREDIVSLINESIDGTSRVRRIVQDLRDFSRIGEADWQWTDLHAGIDSTLNVVRNEIKYKADVVREYGTLPQVECLPSQINQVLMNLLVNAAQAIAEHGTITIRTGASDQQVWVAISDTGCGIDHEHLQKIFDPFFTTKPVGKGTGLGLSVSYGIIEKHGGRIEVASERGKGTTFTIWLPTARGERVGAAG